MKSFPFFVPGFIPVMVTRLVLESSKKPGQVPSKADSNHRITILTTVKIFQFLDSPYCISGQYVLSRKENLIVREYK